MTTLRVIDIETTGWAPPAEIIELGRVDVFSSESGWKIQNPESTLFRAVNGISVETMAVHHITESMVANLDICTPANLNWSLIHGMLPDVLVAHNCAFERGFIPDELTGGRPWICTLKCALRLWPEAVGHSNQVLRYWLGLPLDANLAMPPHRAGPDAYVTAHVLTRMLGGASVDQLINWTSEPKLLPRMPFGKHKNSLWSEIPTDYLAWMTRQSDMDTDVVWCAKQELSKR
jgi:exodeoxyribonuclease X